MDYIHTAWVMVVNGAETQVPAVRRGVAGESGMAGKIA